MLVTEVVQSFCEPHKFGKGCFRRLLCLSTVFLSLDSRTEVTPETQKVCTSDKDTKGDSYIVVLLKEVRQSFNLQRKGVKENTELACRDTENRPITPNRELCLSALEKL